MEINIYTGEGWGGMDKRTPIELSHDVIRFKFDGSIPCRISYLDIERLYHEIQLDKLRQAQEIKNDICQG